MRCSHLTQVVCEAAQERFLVVNSVYAGDCEPRILIIANSAPLPEHCNEASTGGGWGGGGGGCLQARTYGARYP